MTEVLSISGTPDPNVLVETLAALAEGEIVALPTDTTYVLAVNPFVDGTTDALFEVNQRPRVNDLPLLVGTIDQALDLVTALPPAARTLMESCWPGPLTLVLPRSPDLDADLGDDEITVGLRMPDHAVPLGLCRQGGPLAVVAAGVYGKTELQTAQEVADAFGDELAIVLDGGPCTAGHATVVDATGTEPHLIREGRVPWKTLVKLLS
jgi:tRNA threonylcarbamoyl adenosine modification protein (Sua5/YciO/YrdC/YwlC family)